MKSYSFFCTASANFRASLTLAGNSNRKRGLTDSDLDLASFVRHSPTSLQLLGAMTGAAAQNGASPTSSGSFSGNDIYVNFIVKLSDINAAEGDDVIFCSMTQL